MSSYAKPNHKLFLALIAGPAVIGASAYCVFDSGPSWGSVAIAGSVFLVGLIVLIGLALRERKR